MQEKSEKKLLQRILILASSLAFFGSTGAALIGMVITSSQNPEAASPTISVEQQLQAKERGYELVLEREPENPLALYELAQTRQEMKDFAGAIAPLEKLVQLYPQDEKLKQVLEALKQQVAQTSQPNSVPQKSAK
jgi:tetratricopeptide (TPR) repeat protein